MTNLIAFEEIRPQGRPRALRQGLAAGVGLALLTYLGFILGLDLTTMSFFYLLLVLSMAMFCGFWQASFTSLLAVGCLDYFFTQPLFRFAISNFHDWVALGAFQTTALVVARLSAKELRSTREAVFHRTGMEQLYELSRDSLLLDLHEPPGPQLVVLIQRVFGAKAVALFDLHLGRQDRVGNWEENEENIAKECYLQRPAKDDAQTGTWKRMLLTGSVPVGSLAVRGELSPLVVDALASLAVIVINRHQSFENEERAEMASKTEQLRGAVMDALAHEFKTPLTAVHTASSGLLESGGLTESQRLLAALIDDEIVRLSDLCTRLLMTAKLEAQQVGLQTDEVTVQDLISEALSGRPAEEAKSPIQVAVEEPSLTVRVDRALVVMILMQYIDNARKYSTPDTEIGIDARQSHGELVFSVHNFGSMIPIEDRERIFDRFYRSPQLRDTVTGTGIGLSVVRKAANAQRGHVWVISDEKEGTTFYLSLPHGAKGKERTGTR